jgi:hypothetical protein
LDLARQLGCTLRGDGVVRVNELGQATMPGVYAAGDMCRTPAMPSPAAQVIMAAAQGARAAVVIDQELLFTEAYAPVTSAKNVMPISRTARVRLPRQWRWPRRASAVIHAMLAYSSQNPRRTRRAACPAAEPARNVMTIVPPWPAGPG